MMQLTRRFTNQAGDLFSEFDRLFRHSAERLTNRSSLPREFGLYETDRAWMLRTDLPGFRKEDLNIEIRDGILALEGTSSDERELEQSLRLPKGVQVDGISARLEHGVLELSLPKSTPETPEPVQININEQAPE